MQSRDWCSRCKRRRDLHPELFTDGIRTCDPCRAYRNKHRPKTGRKRGKTRRTPAVVCGRKFCSACKRWRQVHEFGVHTWADPIERTTPKFHREKCHHCERLAGRIRNAKLAGRSEPYGQWQPGMSYEERKRRHVQRHKERMESDPKYAENFRERQRIWAEGKRRARGAKNTRAGKKLAGYGQRLPVDPMKTWVEKKLNNGYRGNIGLLAVKCDIDERVLHRIKTKEYDTVTEDVVDHILLAEGSTGLWEIYPHLYDMDAVGS